MSFDCAVKTSLRRRVKKKCLRPKMSLLLQGASVECFCKRSTFTFTAQAKEKMIICDMLMRHLWWQKAPMWFFFVKSCASFAKIRLFSFSENDHASSGIAVTRRRRRVMMPSFLGFLRCLIISINYLPFNSFM